MKSHLTDTVALVTGGNSGIGRAIATALATAGCSVVIAARRDKENKRTAAEIEETSGRKVIALRMDVSREADCRQVIRQTVEEAGGIHILINNAGIAGGGLMDQTDTSTFDRVLKTNLYGPFWCSREAMPYLKKNPVDPTSGVRGAIINISSLNGKEAWSGQGTYSASKFGVMALTQAISDEGRKHRVRATAICPAMVATSLTGVTGDDYIQPEDIARTVLYLLELSGAAWPTEIVLPRRDSE